MADIKMRDIKDEQYNLLSQLAYVDIPKNANVHGNSVESDGKDYTIGAMVDYYLDPKNEDKLKKLDDRCGMKWPEWETTLEMIKKDTNLPSLKITGYTNQDSNDYKDTQGKSGLVAYCFETADHKSIIDYRGSETRNDVGAEDWYDNFKLVFENNTPQQIASLGFLNEMKDKYNYSDFATTGHSKGGNDAQYVAIMSTDVKKSVAFDPPGFNDKFMKTYAPEVKAAKDKMIFYASYLDCVHSFLNNRANRAAFIDTPSQGFDLFNNHKDNLFLFDNSDLAGYGQMRPQKEENSIMPEISLVTNMLSGQLSKEVGESVTNGIYDLATDRRGKLAILTDKNFMESVAVLLPCLNTDINSSIEDYVLNTIKSKDSVKTKIMKVSGAAAVDVIYNSPLVNMGKLAIEKGVVVICVADEVMDKVKKIYEEGKKCINFFKAICNSYEKVATISSFGEPISVNTDRLLYYSQRLSSVNSRIKDVDSRLRSLYLDVEIKDLPNLGRVDWSLCNGSTIGSCTNYLNNAAATFQNAEMRIMKMANEVKLG